MTIRQGILIAILGMMGWLPPAAVAGDIVVLAASSLTNAFKAIGRQFEAEHTGARVLLSFGASDVVLRQIVNGAPADVFASADEITMDKAVAEGVVEPATRTVFAQNELVLIVPADSKRTIGSLADLDRPGVDRITLGNPASVPVGRYTEAALKQIGMWAPLQDRMIYAQNVRQALDYVARGEVDAGFVFATDAAIMPEKVRVVAQLASPVPVRYPIALILRKSRSARAKAFIDDVLSAPGQAILSHYGFRPPAGLR
jgi:molybdate transport system substrate-binding protein